MHSVWDVSLARYVTFYMLIHVLNNTTISGCMCVRIEWLLVGTDKWLFLLMTGFLSWPALHRTAPLWKLLPPDKPFCSSPPLCWVTGEHDRMPLCPLRLHLHKLKDPFPRGREIPPRSPRTPLAPWRYTLSVIGQGHLETRGKHERFFVKSHLADAQHSGADVSNISCYLDSSNISQLGLRIDRESGGPDVRASFWQVTLESRGTLR